MIIFLSFLICLNVIIIIFFWVEIFMLTHLLVTLQDKIFIVDVNLEALNVENLCYNDGVYCDAHVFLHRGNHGLYD